MVEQLTAIAPDLVAGQEGSRQNPPRYIATNGLNYWLKGNPQAAGPHNCLVAELLAGRLGASIGASPPVAVIELPSMAALPEHRQLVGWCFGSRDIPGSLNIRQFKSRGLAIPLEAFDPTQAALVWAFQVWIGQGDWQCLINSADGRIYSLDHENWSSFEAPASPCPPVHNHEDLGPVGCDATAVDRAATIIEAMDEDAILEMCTDVPQLTRLEVPAGHLEAVAESLIRRKHHEVRQRMMEWLRA